MSNAQCNNQRQDSWFMLPTMWEMLQYWPKTLRMLTIIPLLIICEKQKRHCWNMKLFAAAAFASCPSWHKTPWSLNKYNLHGKHFEYSSALLQSYASMHQLFHNPHSSKFFTNLNDVLGWAGLGRCLIDPVLMNNDTRIQDAATAQSAVHQWGHTLVRMIFISVFTYSRSIWKLSHCCYTHKSHAWRKDVYLFSLRKKLCFAWESFQS